jgi:hypothetical protein
VIAKVGSRSIHQYWHLLAPDFQGILLTPQRRPDEGGVAWTWQEAVGNKPVTAPELAEVRERLVRANRAFAKNLPDADASGPGGRSAQEATDLLRSKVDEMVTKLAGKSDEKLAGYVARTDGGPMLHSWGASVPAQPFYPDSHNCEVSGVVLVGDKDAADFEVLIESRKGVCLARTRSDASGAFRLEKIGPGTHRVRVISDRVDFPVNGVSVTVERTSITNLELRSTSLNVASAVAPPPGSPISATRIVAPAVMAAREALENFSRASPRRRWLVASSLALLAIVVAGGGWWAWRWWHASDLPAGHEAGAFPTNVLPLSAGGAKTGQPRSGMPRLPDTGLTASASRGTVVPRAPAQSTPTAFPLAAAAGASSTEPTRPAAGSAIERPETHEPASTLNGPAVGDAEGTLPAADTKFEEPSPTGEVADASERQDQASARGRTAAPAIQKSPKSAHPTGGKTGKSMPAASAAPSHESAVESAPSAKPVRASARRDALLPPAAVNQAKVRSIDAEAASASAETPADAGGSVGSPEQDEDPAVPAAAISDSQLTKTGKSEPRKLESALRGSGGRAAQATPGGDRPSTNPARVSDQLSRAPRRTNAVKVGKAVPPKVGASVAAVSPAETAAAGKSSDSEASSDEGEAPLSEKRPGTSAVAAGGGVRGEAQVAGTASSQPALQANGAKPDSAPVSDRNASASAAAANAGAARSSRPGSAVPKERPMPGDIPPETNSAETESNSESPSAPPLDQKSAVSAAAKEPMAPSTAPAAAVALAEASPAVTAPAVNVTATPSSAPAQRSSGLPKAHSTRASIKSDRSADRAGGNPAPENAAVPAESDAVPPAQVDSGRVSEPGRLDPAVKVRISGWAPRLVQDVILPTQLVRDGEDDALELLRERLFQERKDQIPQTLKHPVIRFGLVLEVPANGDGQQLRWREAEGRVPAGATIRGQRAEIFWPGGISPGDGESVLLSSNRREIARIKVDPQLGLILEASKEVACRYWVAVERASADEVGLPRTQAASRFDWRLLQGAPLPSACSRDDDWQGGRGQRLELPVGNLNVGNAASSLALVDQITGWAIVSEVSQTIR